eukprot:TRINITY_DN4739_c0_g2_i1.p1 TRINITY_DN4739_c0_g2~~TRINITY_DN4739_c0_g2_i1.p1  ORF type:complete len:886 (+),score=206.48 TRINITY_DN4739_c0_g2_i1:122-2779(+)
MRPRSGRACISLEVSMHVFFVVLYFLVLHPKLSDAQTYAVTSVYKDPSCQVFVYSQAVSAPSQCIADGNVFAAYSCSSGQVVYNGPCVDPSCSSCSAPQTLPAGCNSDGNGRFATSSCTTVPSAPFDTFVVTTLAGAACSGATLTKSYYSMNVCFKLGGEFVLFRTSTETDGSVWVKRLGCGQDNSCGPLACSLNSTTLAPSCDGSTQYALNLKPDPSTTVAAGPPPPSAAVSAGYGATTGAVSSSSSSSSSAGSGSAASGAATGSVVTFVTIDVQDNAFSPNNLTISVGTIVRWTVTGVNDHTITSGTPTDGPDGQFDFGPVSLNPSLRSFTYTFLETGTFAFYCKVHPSMTGVIRVESYFDVSIESKQFVPPLANVSRGTTVRWTNNDHTPHTVTSGLRPATATSAADPSAGLFDRSLLQFGDVFSYTFETAGVFNYFCALHTNMNAQVNVVGQATTGTPASTGVGAGSVTTSTSSGQASPTTGSGLFIVAAGQNGAIIRVNTAGKDMYSRVLSPAVPEGSRRQASEALFVNNDTVLVTYQDFAGEQPSTPDFFQGSYVQHGSRLLGDLSDFLSSPLPNTKLWFAAALFDASTIVAFTLDASNFFASGVINGALQLYSTDGNPSTVLKTSIVRFDSNVDLNQDIIFVQRICVTDNHIVMAESNVRSRIVRCDRSGQSCAVLLPEAPEQQVEAMTVRASSETLFYLLRMAQNSSQPSNGNTVTRLFSINLDGTGHKEVALPGMTMGGVDSVLAFDNVNDYLYYVRHDYSDVRQRIFISRTSMSFLNAQDVYQFSQSETSTEGGFYQVSRLAIQPGFDPVPFAVVPQSTSTNSGSSSGGVVSSFPTASGSGGSSPTGSSTTVFQRYVGHTHTTLLPRLQAIELHN